MKKKFLDLYFKLSSKVEELKFSSPVEAVYNPLNYARSGFEEYINKFFHDNFKIIFLGMNPGPFGMAQTGVPFGEVEAVKNWLGLKNISIKIPEKLHPSYPVVGLDCKRSEVSGKRLWGLFKERFKTPENFFKEHLVLNYCPLLFIASGSKGGRNLTPDKLKINERKELFKICNECFRAVIEILNPEYIVGIGNFAALRAEESTEGLNVKIFKILHPSPASPLSAKDWPGKVTKQLVDYGIWN